MAVLIPALGACVHRMTSGERRLAARLEHKLDDDYLLWYDVPVGPKQAYPDFVVIHPRRGLLILEAKDWRLDTIIQAGKQAWDILGDTGPKAVINPLEQARHCAVQVVRALERDAQLVHAEGPHQGKLVFPWGHGVVFTRITRKQFDAAGLGEAIEPHRVICQDEMLEQEEPEAFQQRLWDMLLANAHQDGHAWGDMAVLCRRKAAMAGIARALQARGLPHEVRDDRGDYDPISDTVKVMTMHASKGLEFPVVALSGVGEMPGENDDVGAEARLFYVATTRATNMLIFTGSDTSAFVKRLIA